MAATRTLSLMTAEELFQLPDDGYKYELVEGELIRLPPTGGEHGDVALNVGFLLKGYIKAHDLGIVCAAETGFILKRNPDIEAGTKKGASIEAPLSRLICVPTSPAPGQLHSVQSPAPSCLLRVGVLA
jgi:Uma2 family endonuclease